MTKQSAVDGSKAHEVNHMPMRLFSYERRKERRRPAGHPNQMATACLGQGKSKVKTGQKEGIIAAFICQ